MSARHGAPARVLGFGTYDVGSHPRVQVLLEGLAGRGLAVRELDEPLGLDTAGRVAILRQPWRLPVLVGRLASRWSRLAAGTRRYRGRHAPDALLVGYMGHFDVLLARVLYPRTTIILDHLVFAAGTASDRGASGARVRLLEVLDTLATTAADVVVVDTAEHAARLARRAQGQGVVVPVGAPRPWYEAGRRAARARQSSQGSPHGPSAVLRVVFFGLFTPLQGTPTIARALRILADTGASVRATMIGSGQDRPECERILRGTTTVQWRDWVDPASLPDLVASHDVCLGIMGTTRKAFDVVPNKAYQGMAAGCAVVTSDTPPQRRVLGEGAVLVPPGDADALAQALARLSHDPGALEDARRRAAAAAQSLTAAQAVEPLERLLRTRRRPRAGHSQHAGWQGGQGTGRGRGARGRHGQARP